MLSKPSKKIKISNLRSEIIEGKTLRIYFPKDTFPLLIQLYVELLRTSGEGEENPVGTVWCFLQVDGTDILYRTQNTMMDATLNEYFSTSASIYSDEPYIELLISRYNFDAYDIEGVVTANFNGFIEMEV